MTATTTQLSLYNGALRHLGERKLVSVANTSEPARVLNDIWDDGFTTECLEAGQWIFATRTQQFTADPSIEPDFGAPFVFEKPTDWVRTTGVWFDPNLTQPLVQYTDSAGFWSAYVEQIYVSYVSNDPMYGGTLSVWPSAMVSWVEAFLAWKACYRITQDEGLEEKIGKKYRKMLLEAKSLNAQANPTRFPPQGTWTSSRLGGWGGNRGGGWY